MPRRKAGGEATESRLAAGGIRERKDRGGLSNKMKEAARVMALFLASCAPASGTERPASPDRPALTAHGTAESKDAFRGLNRPDINITLFSKDPQTKEYKFDWRFLLAPVQVEIPWDRKVEGTTSFTVPYEYSRLFDSAKTLNPEDKEKLAAFIKGELQKRFAEVLIGLDFSKEVHNASSDHDHNRASGINVRNINIKAGASPEGPAEKGPESIAPGQVDKENIALAELRGKEMIPDLRRTIESMGIDMTNVKNIEINPEEIQFTEAELNELEKIADEMGMAATDRLEKIFYLIRDGYNEGTLDQYTPGEGDDEEILAADINRWKESLNRIVGEKRRVEVVIKYDGNQERRLLIPLPLLLLIPLLGALAWRRRRSPEDKMPSPDKKDKLNKGTEREEPYRQKSTETATRPIAEKQAKGGVIYLTREDAEATRPLRDQLQIVAVPSEVLENTLDNLDQNALQIMEEQVYLDDLNTYFNDKEMEEKGIDYAGWLKWAIKHYKEMSPQTMEAVLADAILKAWIKKDTTDRKSASVEDNSGLDYRRQPRQILYARMHAKLLIDLAGQMRQKAIDDGQANSETLMAMKVAALQRRRSLREKNKQ